MDLLKIFLYIFILNVSVLFVSCWDNEDLELFDLVEEINQNFYDVLGVSNSADAADIRRSYRKLSLQLHPDKNKELDAEEKFRQLVAVYEVLKDEKKRAKYNEVLLNGLPDWRQPVYYYRRVRKMGLIELFILLSIILTTGHFITIWSMYLERCYEKEEVYRSRKKRDKKSRRGRQTDDDEDDEMLHNELSQIRRPVLTDLLPFAVLRLILRLVTSVPSVVLLTIELVKSRFVAVTDDENEELPTDKLRTVRKRPNLTGPAPEMLPFETPAYSAVQSESSEQSDNNTCSVMSADSGEWTDTEIALLAKAVARYPGGSTNRWQKISEMVGRSVQEVTTMAHQVKAHCARSVDPSSQGITATRLPNCLADQSMELTENPAEYEISEMSTDKTLKKRTLENSVQSLDKVDSISNSTVTTNKPATKKTDRTLLIAQMPTLIKPSANSGATNTQMVADSAAKGMWSQQQQRLLEIALSQHPKGTTDRWDRIAELVPDKTKDECIQRCKYLADLVVKKKQQKHLEN